MAHPPLKSRFFRGAFPAPIPKFFYGQNYTPKIVISMISYIIIIVNPSAFQNGMTL